MSDQSARLASALSNRYTLDRELGAGGMATVFLAHDIKQDRPVAIKVLKPGLAIELGPERFLNEISTTANLRHPHILPLYESGEADGFLYYVMPYIEGESLRDRLERERQIPIEDALQITREVADALQYAHDHGVVHRDIKPANILLEQRHALVADFGVARAVHGSATPRLTGSGTAVGTPTYMSPEQASGDRDIDGRTDLYALACVLYEMLAGQPPFTGATAEALVRQHIITDPAPVTNLRPAVPAHVVAALQRALAKAPADRFKSVAKFADALQPTGPATPTVGRRIPWRRVVAALFVVAIGVTAVWLFGRHRTGAPPVSGLNRLAVLPFSTSGDSTNEAFAIGEHAELVAQLTRLTGMHVSSRSATIGYRDQSNLPRIAQELGVDHLVAGTIQRSGDRVHVTVELIDPTSRNSQWAGTYDTLLSAANIFAIQGDIARNVAVALKSTLTVTDQAVLNEVPTQNLDALDAYRRGLVLWENQGGNTNADVAQGVQAIIRAVQLDPQFARAWALLSQMESWRVFGGMTNDTLPARVALDRVTALAPGGSDAATSEGYYYYYALGDFPRSIRAFETLRTLQPDLAAAHQALGLLYRRVSRWEEAVQSFERAIPLDPRNVRLLAAYSETLLFMRRFDQARAVIDRGLAIAPGSGHMIERAFQLRLAALGDTAGARALLAAAPHELTDENRAGMVADLAWTTGHFAEALQVLRKFPDATGVFEGDNLWLQAMLERLGGNTPAMMALAIRMRRSSDSGRRALRAATNVDRQLLREDVAMVGAAASIMLGDTAKGVALAEQTNQTAQAAQDAMSAQTIATDLILVYIVAGKTDKALDQVEHLLSIPSDFYVASLKLDPIFASLRASPRFATIIAGKK